MKFKNPSVIKLCAYVSKEFKNERFYHEIILLVLRILISERHGEIREDLGRGNKQGHGREIRLMEGKG